jgi:hypothetical protein
MWAFMQALMRPCPGGTSPHLGQRPRCREQQNGAYDQNVLLHRVQPRQIFRHWFGGRATAKQTAASAKVLAEINVF